MSQGNVIDTRLIEFYVREGTDCSGRTWKDIIRFDDDELEATHDYVQWLFPLYKQSTCVPDSPTLDDSIVCTLRSSLTAQIRLDVTIGRMLMFYGMTLHPTDERYAWWARPNHNLMRITRILRSVHILRGRSKAEELHALFVAAAATGTVPENTFAFWRWALGHPAPEGCPC